MRWWKALLRAFYSDLDPENLLHLADLPFRERNRRVSELLDYRRDDALPKIRARAAALLNGLERSTESIPDGLAPDLARSYRANIVGLRNCMLDVCETLDDPTLRPEDVVLKSEIREAILTLKEVEAALGFAPRELHRSRKLVGRPDDATVESLRKWRGQCDAQVGGHPDNADIERLCREVAGHLRSAIDVVRANPKPPTPPL